MVQNLEAGPHRHRLASKSDRVPSKVTLFSRDLPLALTVTMIHQGADFRDLWYVAHATAPALSPGRREANVFVACANTELFTPEIMIC